MKENAKIFDKSLKFGPNYFRQWYARVRTRCFGENLPYKFMHPVFDKLNHSHLANSSL